jgi:hypothetical protein
MGERNAPIVPTRARARGGVENLVEQDAAVGRLAVRYREANRSLVCGFLEDPDREIERRPRRNAKPPGPVRGGGSVGGVIGDHAEIHVRRSSRWRKLELERYLAGIPLRDARPDRGEPCAADLRPYVGTEDDALRRGEMPADVEYDGGPSIGRKSRRPQMGQDGRGKGLKHEAGVRADGGGGKVRGRSPRGFS